MTKILGPILILGARSDIGRALAHRYAQSGYDIILAARGAERLSADVEDLKVRHRISASAVEFDVTDQPSAFLERLEPAKIGTVICVVGAMGDQAKSMTDPAAAADVMVANYVGPACTLDALTPRVSAGGTIIGISSVAGDRGRATNYVYGSAKAGFTAYLSGMRNHWAKKGLHVMTVKPGFVRTQMTAGMKLPGPLTANPVEVASAIFSAHGRGTDVLYTRLIWRLVMTIICAIPERIFKNIKI